MSMPWPFPNTGPREVYPLPLNLGAVKAAPQPALVAPPPPPVQAVAR